MPITITLTPDHNLGINNLNDALPDSALSEDIQTANPQFAYYVALYDRYFGQNTDHPNNIHSGLDRLDSVFVDGESVKTRYAQELASGQFPSDRVSKEDYCKYRCIRDLLEGHTVHHCTIGDDHRASAETVKLNSSLKERHPNIFQRLWLRITGKPWRSFNQKQDLIYNSSEADTVSREESEKKASEFADQFGDSYQAHTSLKEQTERTRSINPRDPGIELTNGRLNTFLLSQNYSSLLSVSTMSDSLRLQNLIACNDPGSKSPNYFQIMEKVSQISIPVRDLSDPNQLADRYPQLQVLSSVLDYLDQSPECREIMKTPHPITENLRRMRIITNAAMDYCDFIASDAFTKPRPLTADENYRAVYQKGFQAKCVLDYAQRIRHEADTFSELPVSADTLERLAPQSSYFSLIPRDASLDPSHSPLLSLPENMSWLHHAAPVRGSARFLPNGSFTPRCDLSEFGIQQEENSRYEDYLASKQKQTSEYEKRQQTLKDLRKGLNEIISREGASLPEDIRTKYHHHINRFLSKACQSSLLSREAADLQETSAKSLEEKMFPRTYSLNNYNRRIQALTVQRNSDREAVRPFIEQTPYLSEWRDRIQASYVSSAGNERAIQNRMLEQSIRLLNQTFQNPDTGLLIRNDPGRQAEVISAFRSGFQKFAQLRAIKEDIRFYADLSDIAAQYMKGSREAVQTRLDIRDEFAERAKSDEIMQKGKRAEFDFQLKASPRQAKILKKMFHNPKSPQQFTNEEEEKRKAFDSELDNLLTREQKKAEQSAKSAATVSEFRADYQKRQAIEADLVRKFEEKLYQNRREYCQKFAHRYKKADKEFARNEKTWKEYNKKQSFNSKSASKREKTSYSDLNKKDSSRHGHAKQSSQHSASKSAKSTSFFQK